MKTQAQEAIELLQSDDSLNTVVFVKTSKNEEKVEYFSWVSLLEKHSNSRNLNKIYQEFNEFVNQLSLYSLDSFINSYNHQKDLLLVIAARAYEPEDARGFEFQIFFEVSSLLEQAREQLVKVIEDKENNLVKPYLKSQLSFLENVPANKGEVISFFSQSLKLVFNFDKQSPKELSRFKLANADSKEVRIQMQKVVNSYLNS